MSFIVSLHQFIFGGIRSAVAHYWKKKIVFFNKSSVGAWLPNVSCDFFNVIKQPSKSDTNLYFWEN